MSTRTALGMTLVFAFNLAAPAIAADELSVHSLGSRLAAMPNGEEAEALAKDVRAWFGKDRNDRNNVLSGANPKVKELETAWAIEAPNAKTAAVVTSDGKSVPLFHIDGTSLFAGTWALADGSAFRWTYVSDGNKEERKGQLEVYLDAPELKEMSDVPRGKLTHKEPWESKIFPNTKREWWV